MPLNLNTRNVAGLIFETFCREGLNPAIRPRTTKVHKVRIADIDVHRTEGALCSLSFESERYGPHAYHVDCKAFYV